MPPDDSHHHYVTLARNKEAELVQDEEGQLGLVDNRFSKTYWLLKRSYYEGFKLLGKFPPDQIGIYRDEHSEPIGFWLGANAALVCLLPAKTTLFITVSVETTWLATANGLHQRNNQSNDWDTLLRHTQDNK